MAARRAFIFVLGCCALASCGTKSGTLGPDDGGAASDDGATEADVASSADICAIAAPTKDMCPEAGVPTYSDLAPIFEQRCASCHDGTPGGPWPLTQYSVVAAWADSVQADLVDCSMPPTDAGVALTVDEKRAILTWTACGHPQ